MDSEVFLGTEKKRDLDFRVECGYHLPIYLSSMSTWFEFSYL